MINNNNSQRTWSVGVKLAHVYHRQSGSDFIQMPRFRSYKIEMDSDVQEHHIYYRYVIHGLKHYHVRYDFDYYTGPQYINYEEYSEVSYP